MAKVFSRNKTFILIVALLMAICLSIGVLSYGKIAEAADDPVWDDDGIVIAHITDTHYYPIRYAHNGDSEEFFDYVHEQFHKMWFESEAAYKSALEKIKQVKPDYLVMTGDNAQDGERQSHIDVANGLRKLQNDIRGAGVDHFQVFVTFGNHDLYNEAVYDFSDGTKQYTENVSRKDVSIIYAGLGYPNITDAEAQAYYSEDEYEGNNAEYGYVHSELKEDIDFVWQYDESDDDYEEGELTYIAETSTGYTFIGLDVVESNEEEGHVLGATLTKDTQQFLIDNKTDSEFSIGLAHHSIVPHFKLQKELLTGFIINDWINGADFLADYGMRYVFTGHMHANDITHHISFNNNQITDIETAANLSIESSVRYATIQSGTLGDKRVQNLYVKNDYLDEIDMSYAIDNDYLTERYIEYNGLEEYVDWENKKIINYSDYARKRMYDNTITNVFNAYLNPAVINMLTSMVTDFIPDSVIGLPMSGLKNNIVVLVDTIISQINSEILADYEYSGDNPIYQENKLFGFIEELANRALAIEVAPDTKVFEFVMYCYLNHIYGNEPNTIADMPENIQQGLEYVESGQFVKELFDILLDKEMGLYFLVEKIINTSFDLSEVSGVKLIINSFSSMIDYDELTISNFIIGEIIPRFLSSDLATDFSLSFDLDGKNLMEFVDVTLEDYLTESVYTGMGEIVSNILTAFGTDPVFDGNATQTLITLNAGEEYTFTSTPREDVPTLQNGKLPSKIAVTFGEDTATTKNFTWFTDMRITDSVIQFMEGNDIDDFDAADAESVNGTTEVYGYTVGLIDVGIFATLGYTEAGRHTVELTGLKPNTEYLYRVGSSIHDYFSEVFKFKTAPNKEDAPFEILLISDPQGFTNKTYEKIGEALGAAQDVFDKGYDFVINTGDVVDNSKNVTQYDYYLNTLREYWANTTQVIAVGNHGKNSFEMKEGYNASSDDVVTDEYNYLLMHFNFSIPEQDTTTGAYYSYDYSGVHFTVLNTNDIEDDKLSQTQLDWLKDDLKNTQKQHKVVLMHKSLYSAGAHSYDTEIINMRSQLGPVFEENGVHLVLSGHDHTYNETFYIDGEGKIKQVAKNRTDKVGNKGTLFVNLGTIGNKFYKFVENEEVPVFTGEELHNPTLSNPTFGKLVFDGKDLYYQGYEYDYDTKTVIAINPPTKFTGLEIALIVIGSVLGAAGIGVGVFFVVKTQKGKKVKVTSIDNQENNSTTLLEEKAAAEALAAEDEKEDK